MILVFCMSCAFAMRVLDDPQATRSLVGPESTYWPDKFRCPKCDRRIAASLESAADPLAMRAFTVVDLTAHELFLVCEGQGLPSERKCDAATVTELFKLPISRVHGYEVPHTGRFIIECLEFVGGTKAYLGASAHGALIYRMVQPPNYSER